MSIKTEVIEISSTTKFKVHYNQEVKSSIPKIVNIMFNMGIIFSLSLFGIVMAGLMIFIGCSYKIHFLKNILIKNRIKISLVALGILGASSSAVIFIAKKIWKAYFKERFKTTTKELVKAFELDNEEIRNKIIDDNLWSKIDLKKINGKTFKIPNVNSLYFRFKKDIEGIIDLGKEVNFRKYLDVFVIIWTNIDKDVRNNLNDPLVSSIIACMRIKDAYIKEKNEDEIRTFMDNEIYTPCLNNLGT